MRICIIGKFPPIQGGVSMRTYWTAHALAARGHEVHVVTNANEATPPFRMHMRAEDWARCEARSATGSVTVHWTDPIDRSQSYIPMASPFVSKLAAIAARLHSAHAFDVLLSHYMEPYGVAGYLASQMTGVPHVARMAGSDAGRLWKHPQLEPLYDHVLRSASFVIAAGAVAERAAQRGVDRDRIVAAGGYSLPQDLFKPEGADLDFAALRNEIESDPDLRDTLWGGFAGEGPYFGICGKLGDKKGSFALLAAAHRLKVQGLDFGLVALAHGRPDIEARFRERAQELELTDRILQIPFLPHWRVPEFLRGCLAVCCLEQDFPIAFHSPIIPLEVLLSGSCLVVSAEVIRKLPNWDRLPHGYGCVAIKDVNDVQELSGKLASILQKPKLVAAVGARGHAYAQDCLQDMNFPVRLEQILLAAAQRGTLRSVSPAPAADARSRPFPLARIAEAALADSSQEACAAFRETFMNDTSGLAYAQDILTRLRREIANGNAKLSPFAQAVEIEIAIAQAEIDNRSLSDVTADPLFRICINSWALDEREAGRLFPVHASRLRILRFDQDIPALINIQSKEDFPTSIGPGPSYVVVGAAAEGPLLVDHFTARILELSDGTRTCSQIVDQLDEEFPGRKSKGHSAWLENLLVSGLIGLREAAQTSR